MRSRLFSKIVLSVIIITIFGIIGIIGLAVFVSSPIQPQTLQNSLLPPGAAITPTPNSISVVASTTNSVTVRSTVTESARSSLIVNNPTDVAVGEVIKLQDLLYSRAGGISLKRTDKPSNLSVDQALDYNLGTPWKYGGLWEGTQITVTVTFGLGSLGSLQADGSWYASIRAPEYTCIALRKCTPTGKTLDRIENRPMWLIDYDGLKFCGTAVCYDHTVYIVDDITGALFYAFGYSLS